MNTLIRNATFFDMPIMLELLCDLERPSPINDMDTQKFKDILSKYITDKDKTLFVAERNETVVGLASVIFLIRCNQKQLEMYIPELIVQSTHRGSGIGKMLIHHCILLAHKKQCYRIRLESGNQRRDSHLFYERMGFLQSALSYDYRISD